MNEDRRAEMFFEKLVQKSIQSAVQQSESNVHKAFYILASQVVDFQIKCNESGHYRHRAIGVAVDEIAPF